MLEQDLFFRPGEANFPNITIHPIVEWRAYQ